MVSVTRRSATSKTIDSARSTASVDVVGQVVAELGDLAGHADQPAQQGVLLDDAGVAAGVGGRRRVGLQRDRVGRAADGVEQAGPAQLVGHRDRVGRLARGVQRADGVEDVAVGRLVEVVGAAASRRRRRWRPGTAAWRRAATPRPRGCGAGPGRRASSAARRRASSMAAPWRPHLARSALWIGQSVTALD